MLPYLIVVIPNFFRVLYTKMPRRNYAVHTRACSKYKPLLFITPHAQRERGKVIGCGVHICLWTKKIFESYFRDRLAFSNIRNRTSPRIYRLALPLRAPEKLSSLSKSRISIFNAHLTLIFRRIDVTQFHR